MELDERKLIFKSFTNSSSHLPTGTWVQGYTNKSHIKLRERLLKELTKKVNNIKGE